MALKVKLVRSLSGHPHDQRDTVRGLGLGKMNSTKLLQDTPPIRGMIAKVKHLITVETVDGVAPKRVRFKKKKAAAGKEA